MEGRSIKIPNKDDHSIQATFADVFRWSVAGLLVILFGYTGISKIIDYDVFIFQMRLAPVPFMQSTAPFLGIAVPVIELGIAAFLIPDVTRFKALQASLVLMLAFETYIIWMRATGLDLPCTCGGIISKMSWSAHTVFNGVVILLIALAITLKTKNRN